ncbi:MAG: hypothetical protein HY303_22250 [Candidatus Wallbacteria bacterium]|nr:hypothetical protein [Candidatus Wallbacteria bacterium]
MTVVIEQEQYDFLERKAHREETTVDAFLRQYIERLALEGRDEESRLARDPVFRLPPAYRSTVADLGRQHDHYLYGTPRK